jgi:hypothetical protein
MVSKMEAVRLCFTALLDYVLHCLTECSVGRLDPANEHVTMAMTHYRDEGMQKQPVLGGHPVATTHAATKERQPVNTFFIRADNLPWRREIPAAPSTLVSAIMLVTRADPSTSPWGDYVGNVSRIFNADGR